MQSKVCLREVPWLFDKHGYPTDTKDPITLHHKQIIKLSISLVVEKQEGQQHVQVS